MKLKLIMFGPSSAGKTCLLSQVAGNGFIETHDPTIGMDFARCKLTVSNVDVELNMWEATGMKAFSSITYTYFRGANLVLLVVDATNLSDAKDYINRYSPYIEREVEYDATTHLVINKVDLLGNDGRPNKNAKIVELKNMLSICDGDGRYHECSAKTGHGLQLFENIAKQEVEKIYDNLRNDLNLWKKQRERYHVKHNVKDAFRTFASFFWKCGFSHEEKHGAVETFCDDPKTLTDRQCRILLETNSRTGTLFRKYGLDSKEKIKSHFGLVRESSSTRAQNSREH